MASFLDSDIFWHLVEYMATQTERHITMVQERDAAISTTGPAG